MRVMSRYELYCPPVRQWPALGRERFLWLYDTAMDRVIPWRWMCSAILMPGTPSRAAVDGLPQAALSAETAKI
jgi:hypothetical protein